MSDPDALAPGEHEQLVYALETRFAPHVEAAGTVVREAERALAEAREQLARAEQEAGSAPYTSDPLTFMRASVTEELEGLERKTTGKKLRASYRFLLDRAVEQAGAEVQRFHDDEADAQRERTVGIEASRAAVQRAEHTLEAARQAEERVRGAENSARQGLDVLAERLRP